MLLKGLLLHYLDHWASFSQADEHIGGFQISVNYPQSMQEHHGAAELLNHLMIPLDVWLPGQNVLVQVSTFAVLHHQPDSQAAFWQRARGQRSPPSCSTFIVLVHHSSFERALHKVQWEPVGLQRLQCFRAGLQQAVTERDDVRVTLGRCSHGPKLLQVEFDAFWAAAGQAFDGHSVSSTTPPARLHHMTLKYHTITASPHLPLQHVHLLHHRSALTGLYVLHKW